MGLPLAALALPAIGATMGGIEGYKRGGLGGALLGGGLGAATPAGLRLAGGALAGTKLGAALAPGVYKGAKALGLGGASSSIIPEVQRRAGLAILPGALTTLGVGLGAPALGGMIGGSVAGGGGQAAGNAAQLGAGVIGYTADGAPVYGNIGGGALPPGMGQYGPTSPYGGPLDVLGPAGMGQRLQTLKDAQTQRDVMRTILPEIMEASEARSKKEFERNMAAAGIRQNIATRAEMQRAAQQAGLQAGLTGLQQAGAAATRQYQYQ